MTLISDQNGVRRVFSRYARGSFVEYTKDTRLVKRKKKVLPTQKRCPRSKLMYLFLAEDNRITIFSKMKKRNNPCSYERYFNQLHK